MPSRPARPATPPPVARLTPDEQIAYLFHQNEGFADWRISMDGWREGVDEKLGKVDALAANVDTMRNEVRENNQKNAENNVLLREMMLFLRGQQSSGLEVPGISARLQKLEDCHAADTERIRGLEEFKFRALVMAGLLASGFGLVSWKAAPYIVQILAIFK